MFQCSPLPLRSNRFQVSALVVLFLKRDTRNLTPESPASTVDRFNTPVVLLLGPKTMENYS
jgi:hypothetical protein